MIEQPATACALPQAADIGPRRTRPEAEHGGRIELVESELREVVGNPDAAQRNSLHPIELLERHVVDGTPLAPIGELEHEWRGQTLRAVHRVESGVGEHQATPGRGAHGAEQPPITLHEIFGGAEPNVVGQEWGERHALALAEHRIVLRPTGPLALLHAGDADEVEFESEESRCGPDTDGVRRHRAGVVNRLGQQIAYCVAELAAAGCTATQPVERPQPLECRSQRLDLGARFEDAIEPRGGRLHELAPAPARRETAELAIESARDPRQVVRRARRATRPLSRVALLLGALRGALLLVPVSPELRLPVLRAAPDERLAGNAFPAGWSRLAVEPRPTLEHAAAPRRAERGRVRARTARRAGRGGRGVRGRSARS